MNAKDLHINNTESFGKLKTWMSEMNSAWAVYISGRQFWGLLAYRGNSPYRSGSVWSKYMSQKSKTVGRHRNRSRSQKYSNYDLESGTSGLGNADPSTTYMYMIPISKVEFCAEIKLGNRTSVKTSVAAGLHHFSGVIFNRPGGIFSLYLVIGR